MRFQWILTVAVALVALAALVRARRAAKRLERLTESYWELRYELGQLKSRLARLDPESQPSPADAEAARQQGTSAFIPLSSLKR